MAEKILDPRPDPPRRAAIAVRHAHEPGPGGPPPAPLSEGRLLRHGGLGRRRARLGDALPRTKTPGSGWKRSRRPSARPPSSPPCRAAATCSATTPIPTRSSRASAATPCSSGIDIMRIFDALNDIDNMKSTIRFVKQNGGIADCAVCYTVDPQLHPGRPRSGRSCAAGRCPEDFQRRLFRHARPSSWPAWAPT